MRSSFLFPVKPSGLTCSFFRFALVVQATVLSWVMLLIPLQASAQNAVQPSAPAIIQRDTVGVAAITHALDALGGMAAIAALRDTKAEASCTRTSNTTSDTHLVRWMTAGEYFRYDGGENDQRGMSNGPSGTAQVVSRKTMAVTVRSMRAMRPIHLPGLLLFEDLSQSKNKIQVLDPAAVGGVLAIHIRVTDAKATDEAGVPIEEDWFLDPKTALPLKLTFAVVAFNSRFMFAETAVAYSGYETIQGVVIPRIITRSFEGGPTTTCSVSSFIYNQNPDPSIFSPVKGGGQ